MNLEQQIFQLQQEKQSLYKAFGEQQRNLDIFYNTLQNISKIVKQDVFDVNKLAEFVEKKFNKLKIKKMNLKIQLKKFLQIVVQDLKRDFGESKLKDEIEKIEKTLQIVENLEGDLIDAKRRKNMEKIKQLKIKLRKLRGKGYENIINKILEIREKLGIIKPMGEVEEKVEKIKEIKVKKVEASEIQKKMIEDYIKLLINYLIFRDKMNVMYI